MDKIWIVLFATSGGVSTASFASVIDTPVGIASETIGFVYCLTTEIMKKLLETTQNRRKKHAS